MARAECYCPDKTDLSSCVRPALVSATPPVGIELRHLRYFLAVMEELHFGRAADRLHIAQPPLSQAVRKVEDQLGVQLLHRTTRVVTPTEAGRTFAERAADVLASLDRAVAEARSAGGARQLMRVGSIPHLPLERLQAFLHALEARDPAARARVTHLHSGEQIRQLRDGSLEVGIFDDPGPVSGLETEPLFAGEPLVAFVPRSHPLAERTILTPDDLRREVLVTHPRDGYPAVYDRLAQIIQGAGYSFAGLDEASSMEPRDLLLAVDGGRGVALGPASYASDGDARKLVRDGQLDPPVTMPDTVLAWARHPPRHLVQVLAEIRALARELRAGRDGGGGEVSHERGRDPA